MSDGCGETDWISDLPAPARPFARFLWNIGRRHLRRRRERIEKSRAIGQAAGKAAKASSDATEKKD